MERLGLWEQYRNCPYAQLDDTLRTSEPDQCTMRSICHQRSIDRTGGQYRQQYGPPPALRNPDRASASQPGKYHGLLRVVRHSPVAVSPGKVDLNSREQKPVMQNLLKNLGRLFGAGGTPTGADPDGLYYYVRCARCGEVIQIRLNRNNDLSVEYGDKGDASDKLTAHKVIVGRRCYNRIEADFTFNRGRTLVDKAITGGTFVDASAYQPPSDTPDSSEAK